ncbi:hypothetical protein LTR94_027150, partial [Friedmanniomyces endolithicus]
MRVQRRPQLEPAWISGEVPEPHKAPIAAMLFRHGQFVAADVKGRALPSIGGLHLYKARTTIDLEASDVIAGAIAILVRNPADAIGQIVAPGGNKRRSFVKDDTLLASATERTVAGIALRHVEAPGDMLHLFQFIRRRNVAE